MKNRFATLVVLLLAMAATEASTAQQYGVTLDLPEVSVSRRSSLATTVPARTRRVIAELEGPGCIGHIWASHSLGKHSSRNVIIRIYFDDEPIPYVEAPSGDFFGVMHGEHYYPINTPYLSVQAKIAYNSQFQMPFAKSARVEFEAGDRSEVVYCMVNWQHFPNQKMKENRRFCARWRREFPAPSFGENFFMLDADGPGQLLGYVYGVRLTDNRDRWSHGGADNIYIDGNGEHPSYIRGIGGEDTFGTSDGGSMHVSTTHLSASMPFYQQFDDGAARPSKYVTGYRFFHTDPVYFQKSIHMRFGSMSNDICSTVYWYQEAPVRPFYKMPPFSDLVPGRESPKIPGGTHDLPLPDSGTWWISPVLDDTAAEAAARTPLDLSVAIDPKEWAERQAMHGFIDVLHARRTASRGAEMYIHAGTVSVRCVVSVARAMTAKAQIAWEDRLVLRVNDSTPVDLGKRKNFGSSTLALPLKRGDNVIDVTLTNTRNFNHGGWAFAFHATTPDGQVLLPQAPRQR